MRTYDRLYRFLSSYPDVTLSEEFKKKELESFEKYVNRTENEKKEGTNDEGRKKNAGTDLGETDSDT